MLSVRIFHIQNRLNDIGIGKANRYQVCSTCLLSLDVKDVPIHLSGPRKSFLRLLYYGG